MQKWQKLQQVPNVFAYQFKVNESKYFKGKYCFYLQVKQKLKININYMDNYKM